MTSTRTSFRQFLGSCFKSLRLVQFSTFFSQCRRLGKAYAQALLLHESSMQLHLLSCLSECLPFFFTDEKCNKLMTRVNISQIEPKLLPTNLPLRVKGTEQTQVSKFLLPPFVSNFFAHSFPNASFHPQGPVIPQRTKKKTILQIDTPGMELYVPQIIYGQKNKSVLDFIFT